MDEMQDMGPDEARAAFESLYSKLLSPLEVDSQQPAAESDPTEAQPQPDAATSNANRAEAPAEEPPDQSAQQSSEGSEPVDTPGDGSENGLFDGTVELALPPPVALDRMLQLHKHLKETPHVDVLNLGGSVDNGITIRILLDSPQPLLKILSELPEAERVAEERPQDSKKVPKRKGDPGDEVRRVVITAKA
jgi:hypothetical protein